MSARQKQFLIYRGEDFEIRFDGTSLSPLPFFHAAIWMASSGKGAGSAEISEGKYLEDAVDTLLAALAASDEEAFGEVLVLNELTGSSQWKREAIPNYTWQDVKLEPESNIAASGYYIDLRETMKSDPDRRPYGGTLVPYGKSGREVHRVRIPHVVFARSRDDAQHSALRLTKMEAAVEAAVGQLFPDGQLPARNNERDRLIAKSFRDRKLIAPSDKVIQRYFSKAKRLKEM